MARHWIVAVLWSVVWGVLAVILGNRIWANFIPAGGPLIEVPILVRTVLIWGYPRLIAVSLTAIAAFALSMYLHRPRRPRRRPAADGPAGSETPPPTEYSG